MASKLNTALLTLLIGMTIASWADMRSRLAETPSRREVELQIAGIQARIAAVEVELAKLKRP